MSAQHAFAIVTDRPSNLLGMTDHVSEDQQESIVNFACPDALEELEAPNARTGRFHLGGDCIMTVNYEMGRVTFEGTPPRSFVNVEFDRFNSNRRPRQ